MARQQQSVVLMSVRVRLLFLTVRAFSTRSMKATIRVAWILIAKCVQVEDYVRQVTERSS